MGIEFQMHRAAVDIAKGFRQIQKASSAFDKGKADSGLNHLDKALIDFGTAVDHFAKAENQAYDKAGNEIDKGNKELEKSIAAYGKGNDKQAESHFGHALKHFDKALDLIG